MSAARDVLSAMRAEFDRLAREGRQVSLWWRDDDAVAHTPALDRLLATARSAGMPLSLAAVPAHAEASLAERLDEEDAVTVLVHGWRHENHATPGDKKAEFGPHRPRRELARDAAEALSRADRRFGDRALAVFVPPWNRIDPDFVPHLATLGYDAVSCFGQPRRHDGIERIDTHLDPVDWHGGRSLASPEAIAAMIRKAIERGADGLGFLTHHLIFDEPLWSLSEGMAALAADHPAIRPMGLAEMLNRTAISAPSREDVPA